MSQPDQSPPPRTDKTSRASSKLGSFSRTALRALSRRRSTTIGASSSSLQEPLSSIGSSPSSGSPASPIAGTTSQTVLIGPRKPLPRNSTFSNLPRPTSDPKDVAKHQSRLMSPQATVSNVKSRIPTPCPRFMSPVTYPSDLSESKSISGPDLIMPTLPLSMTRPTRYRHALGRQDHAIHDGVEELKQFTPRPRRTEEVGPSRRRHCDRLESDEKQFSFTAPRLVNSPEVNDHGEGLADFTPNLKSDNARLNTVQARSTPPIKSSSSQDIVVHQFPKPVIPPSARKTSLCASGSGASLGLQNSSFVRASSSGENANLSTTRAPVKPIVSILKPLKQQSHLRSESTDDKLPLIKYDPIEPIPIDRIDQSLWPDPPGVYQSQTTAFWTGRYVSMSDKLKTGAFIKTPSPADEKGEEKMHAMDEERTRHIFAALEESCKTMAAKESLLRFKRAYATKFRKLQILQPGSSLTPAPSTSTENSISSQPYSNQMKNHSSYARFKPPSPVLKSESGDSALSDHATVKGRRNSFMDRLVRKNKRDSLS